MRLFKVMVIATLVGGASSSAAAQSEGPVAGTSGFEGNAGTARFLRFTSPSSAWLVGVDGFYARQDSDDNTFGGDFGFANVRLGLRRYRKTESRVRPFSTISALVGYQSDDSGSGWTLGSSIDLGTTYFFSPHVSLGGAGELTASYQNITGNLARSTVFVSFGGFRLLGAVYF